MKNLRSLLFIYANDVTLKVMWKRFKWKHDGGNLASEIDTEIILNNWKIIDYEYMVKQWYIHVLFIYRFVLHVYIAIILVRIKTINI